VRVIDERTLVIPDYDGNGQYRSWGNVLVNPRVGLLFVDFETPKRLRVNGTAVVSHDDPLMVEFPGAVFLIRVSALRIFPNCPRYIHKMQLVEESVYAPRPITFHRCRHGRPSRSSRTHCRLATATASDPRGLG
jgi:predicted pyridoxine 5'-phosphate oxidase superfamily flavin-nucleotide-binding protein